MDSVDSAVMSLSRNKKSKVQMRKIERTLYFGMKSFF